MIKAVIFDMDGVIIDSEPIHEYAMEETLKPHGVDFAKINDSSFLGKTPKSLFTKLKVMFNLSVDVNELVERKADLAMEKMQQLGPIPGVVELIKELHAKNYKLAIGSGQERFVIDNVLSNFGLTDFFREIICSGDYKKPKPDPEVYLRCAEKLGVKPDECVVIEDAPSGVKSAKSAGMKCVGYNNPSNKGVGLVGADLLIENFKELTIDIIKQLGDK